MTDLSTLRNIGISAHIDSGKTTLTERILFYTQRIHQIHDVRGKDGVGALMDNMDLERERGITIQSAATYCTWADHQINIIDTPGHVDFTIEVERALRVLDGAILVLCGVAGVQSQSITVDRQMRRYNVPRLAFVNKLDRAGADPFKVAGQLRDKLKLNPVMMQVPVGLEDAHRGIVDLVTLKAWVFEGDNGEDIVEIPIPADIQDQVDQYREELLDAASMVDDDLAEAILMAEEEETAIEPEAIMAAVRKGVLAGALCPVFMGSAYKNKGVQPLLDGVNTYLPNPTEVENRALDLDNDEAEFVLSSESEKPLVALAFKLDDGRYGQLTYIRIYQGTITKGMNIFNSRDRKKIKVGRLVRMHSDQMEDIETAGAGDIVALFGVDCASGDTFTDGQINVAMTSMHVPEPVMKIAVEPIDSKSQINMSKALRRFTREDPTFQVGLDPESGETILAGMGELHLDVYIQRMKREYNAEVTVGAPQVAYRETIGRKAEYNYLHKKQTGGAGQYGKVAGYVEPCEEEYEFIDQIVGGVIPREFIPSVDKGFKSMMAKGRLIGFPVTNVRFVLNDGAFHPVDSSDNAFQEAARGAFREVYQRAKPTILEPIMKVSIEAPKEFQGAVIGTLMQRRGVIVGTTEDDDYCVIDAEVPLAEMFAYTNTLRSGTQGKGEFTMEFEKYAPVPQGVAEELIKKHREEKDGGAAKKSGGKKKR